LAEFKVNNFGMMPNLIEPIPKLPNYMGFEIGNRFNSLLSNSTSTQNYDKWWTHRCFFGISPSI